MLASPMFAHNRTAPNPERRPFILCVTQTKLCEEKLSNAKKDKFRKTTKKCIERQRLKTTP
jgi:hypothetical protein